METTTIILLVVAVVAVALAAYYLKGRKQESVKEETTEIPQASDISSEGVENIESDKNTEDSEI